MTRPEELLALRLEDVALPDAILAAARRERLEFADAAGFGVLDWAEVECGGAATRLAGPLELLDLKGRIRRAGAVELAEFVVTLSRRTDAGLEVLGGRLVRASGRFVELRLLPLVAIGAQVEAGAAGAQPPEREPMAAPQVVELKPVVPTKALSEKWAEALAESKRLEKNGANAAKIWDGAGEPAVVVPRRGDLVNHRQFGRCLVVKVDDDHIALRKPDGRVVQLGLPILEFAVQGAEGEATVFDVQVRRG